MKARLLKAIVCVFLGLGSVMGVSMDPEKITLVMTIPEHDDKMTRYGNS